MVRLACLLNSLRSLACGCNFNQSLKQVAIIKLYFSITIFCSRVFAFEGFVRLPLACDCAMSIVLVKKGGFAGLCITHKSKTHEVLDCDASIAKYGTPPHEDLVHDMAKDDILYLAEHHGSFSSTMRKWKKSDLANFIVANWRGITDAFAATCQCQGVSHMPPPDANAPNSSGTGSTDLKNDTETTSKEVETTSKEVETASKDDIEPKEVSTHKALTGNAGLDEEITQARKKGMNIEVMKVDFPSHFPAQRQAEQGKNDTETTPEVNAEASATGITWTEKDEAVLALLEKMNSGPIAVNPHELTTMRAKKQAYEQMLASSPSGILASNLSTMNGKDLNDMEDGVMTATVVVKTIGHDVKMNYYYNSGTKVSELMERIAMVGGAEVELRMGESKVFSYDTISSYIGNDNVITVGASLKGGGVPKLTKKDVINKKKEEVYKTARALSKEIFVNAPSVVEKAHNDLRTLYDQMEADPISAFNGLLQKVPDDILGSLDASPLMDSIKGGTRADDRIEKFVGLLTKSHLKTLSDMMLEGQGLLESSNLTIEMLMVRLFMKDASGQWEWSKVKNIYGE